ncbi:hypothetical protein [Rhodococcoides yunnanense]|uniref:hypothetical protein n=1 Tax=Rhodococcoides yunnanense TaxID=278209 RepID=UPI00093381E4|nr:hypothetical protein [Rhodococcus yunnanensis]
MQTLPRADAVELVAEHIDGVRPGHPVRVAVDGITASGKTTLAHDLNDALTRLGRTTIRLSMDGFHNPRAIRYRQGRSSARGYYEDAYDFTALALGVLLPLGRGGSLGYRRAVIDLASDTAVDEPDVAAPSTAVLIVDGTFLQKPSVADLWDVRIFVDTSFDVARRRGVARDAEMFGGTEKADTAFRERYHAASQMYVEDVDPAVRADIVFVNDDIEHPSVRVRSEPIR